MGLRRGTGPAGGPVVVLAAHLDTVFPKRRCEGPPRGDQAVRPRHRRRHAHAWRCCSPTSARMKANGSRRSRTSCSSATSARRDRATCAGSATCSTKGKYKDRIAAFFSMDGTSTERVTGAVGSRRYRVTFKGPGGHSYGAFGLVNPMAAMGTDGGGAEQVAACRPSPRPPMRPAWSAAAPR